VLLDPGSFTPHAPSEEKIMSEFKPVTLVKDGKVRVARSAAEETQLRFGSGYRPAEKPKASAPKPSAPKTDEK
jgi:hypothetical protein